MRLTVRRLIGLLIFLVIALWFGLRVYQQESISSVASSLEMLHFESIKDVEEATEIETTIRDYHASWQKALEDPEGKYLARLARDKVRFLLLIKRPSALGENRADPYIPKILKAIVDLNQISKHYFVATQGTLAARITTSAQKAEIQVLFNEILNQTDYLKDAYEQVQTQTAHQGEAVLGKLRNKDLIFLFVSLFGIVALSTIIWFVVGAPLTQLSLGMDLVKRDRWKEPLPEKGFGEVAGLIRDFNSMAENLKRQKDLLEKEASTDELTGLLNFRAFQERLGLEIQRAARTKRPLTLILADIDHFKRFNDSKGHLAGNDALREIAQRMRDGCRPYDLVARFGGEEFAIVLPETDKADGISVAERVRELASSNSFKLTLSCGVATYLRDARDLKGLIDQADRRLYEAKTAGRNRVAA